MTFSVFELFFWQFLWISKKCITKARKADASRAFGPVFVQNKIVQLCNLKQSKNRERNGKNRRFCLSCCLYFSFASAAADAIFFCCQFLGPFSGFRCLVELFSFFFFSNWFSFPFMLCESTTWPLKPFYHWLWLLLRWLLKRLQTLLCSYLSG